MMLPREEEKRKLATEEPAAIRKEKFSAAPIPIEGVSSISPRAKPYYANPELTALIYTDIKQRLAKYSAADVCFVCDITGSMDRYISAVKDAIHEFMEDATKVTSLAPRIGFVGFRDKKDDPQTLRKDFTMEPNEITEFIANIQCCGGDDDCEDLIIPMQEALSLDWRSDMLFMYLLIDAPTHGARYHPPEESDYFPADDKEQMLEKLCCHYRNMNINLIILKCNNTVDQMIKIMQTYYDSPMSKMVVIDLPDFRHKLAEQIDFNLSPQMTIAFQQTVRKHFKKITRALVDEEIVPEPDMTMPCDFNGMMYTASFAKQPRYDKMIYDYAIKVEQCRTLPLTISSSKIGAGAFMNCYYMYQQDKPTEKYVAKIPRIPAMRPEDLLPDIEGNIFAMHFALTANNIAGNKMINVVPILIVEIPESERKQPLFHGSKYILAQKYLVGEFKKYNNNYGWASKEQTAWNSIAQAFSHFTYEASIGSLIFVDIQGVVEKSLISLTDPAIHSMLYKAHFGDTNCGTLGILKFFATHKCNVYCKGFSLTNPQDCIQAELSAIYAKHEGEKGYRHLYHNFEQWFVKWQTDLRNFNPALAPQPAPSEPEASPSTIFAEYKAAAEGALLP